MSEHRFFSLGRKLFLNVGFGLCVFLILMSGCVTKAGSSSQGLVLLVHGFGRSSLAMQRIADRLSDLDYEVRFVEYNSYETLSVIQEQVKMKIEEKVGLGTKPIHFVGHSFGGLLLRAYLQRQTVSASTRVVLLGSPNAGTPLVDLSQGEWWGAFYGSAIISTSTQGSKFLETLRPPKYAMGVIAGTKQSVEEGRLLGGRSDGVVPLESAKLPGMSAFIALPLDHSELRTHNLALDQMVHFLLYGRFDQPRG